ncbi:hypothetical protein JHK82_049048 [Glycine max]|nr:hypothetical protein JHK82_049048 [Glycine max]
MGGKSSKGSGRRYDFGASSSSRDNNYGGYHPQSPYPSYQTPQHPRASAPFYDYGQPKRKLDKKYSRIADNYRSLDEVTAALANAGLESSNLIVGIDFTKSNEWTGKRSFNRKSLHDIRSGQNPYEQAISIIGKTLSAFDEDNLIPCFGFGDASTHDQDVFSFYSEERFCNGFEEVLTRYRQIIPSLKLAGPTSFAPIIEMAMTIVEQSGGQYHVLLIIADGQVTRSVDTQNGNLSPQEQNTIDAIVKASEYPLSIVLVGVGDGPWEMMREFDDNIPSRAFDNFQFVNFTEIMTRNVDSTRKETDFALSALMEIPSQYKATLELGILGSRRGHSPDRVALPPPLYSRTSSSISTKSTRSNSFQQRTPTHTSYDSSVHTETSSSSLYDNKVCPICLTNAKDMAFGCGHQDVVKGLGDKGLMVILDNHVSKPQWCCSNDDGNGFFGDQYFDPDLWIKGLTKMATLFKGVTNVVAMSLRNELRGPRQNANDWFKYMPKGAEAVHGANPDVLVIMSGLNYDLDLSFLRKQQVKLSFSGKLVFELHWYSFSDGDSWTTENPNQACGKVTGRVMRSAGYLLEQGYPLVLSEFGWDLRGTNQNDNSYFNCLLPLAAQLDFDWAYWTLAGSYYLREGTVGLIEVYGILTQNTTLPTTTFLLQRISAIQLPYRGPGLSEVEAHKVIFHPLTGLCISGKLEPLKLGPCSNSEGWEYTAQKVLSVKGRNSTCLQAEGEGKEAKLGNECSVWEIISDSKLHLSSKINNASDVCLDVDSNNNIVTNACKCLSGDKTCDPASQWFKLVDSTRKST